MNRAGVVVGVVWNRDQRLQATAWRGGEEKRIFNDDRDSWCTAIDDAGTIYGDHYDNGYVTRGFIRSSSGRIRYIEQHTDRHCFVTAVSQKKQVCVVLRVVGQSHWSSALYQGGKLTPLAATKGGFDCTARGLNDGGVVVGDERLILNGQDRFVPLVWRNGSPEKLPGFPADCNGVAYENNNGGDIIGRFRPTTPRAKTGRFLIHKGRFYDLNRLIEKLNEEILTLRVSRTRASSLPPGFANGKMEKVRSGTNAFSYRSDGVGAGVPGSFSYLRAVLSPGSLKIAPIRKVANKMLADS